MFGLVTIVVLVFTAVSVAGQQIDIQVNPTLPPTKSSQRFTPVPIGKNISVCYRYVGCFDTYPPFDNTGGVLPNPPQKVGTVFLLYTPNSKTVGQQLDYKDKGVSLTKTDFNPLYPTKFVIHGFTQDERELWVHQMKDALLTTGPMNVIIVGWGLGAAAPDYPKAVANTRLVAKQMELLIKLLHAKGMDLSRVHLIGHSLGAHISGYVGAAFVGQLGRISGMDPAGLYYEGTDNRVRLNPTDAKFVDVIHSNGKPVTSAGAGMFAPSGHVDFYPNGGKTQPGCPSFSDILLGLDIKGLSCSHGRSHQLYIESIANGNHCGLIANPCNSMARALSCPVAIADHITTLWSQSSSRAAHFLLILALAGLELKSTEDYQKGKCDSCGEHGCSELGYHSIEYAGRGLYYLLTKGFKTASAPEGEQFCGSIYDIGLTSTTGPKDIKGSIKLKITGSKSSTEASFQGKDNTLGTESKIVIVDYEPLGDILSVTISYDQYEGFLWYSSGTDEWFLDAVTVEKNGKTSKFCNGKATKIETGKPVTIPKCS